MRVAQVRKEPSLVSVYRGLAGDLGALGVPWAQEAALLVGLHLHPYCCIPLTVTAVTKI